MKVLVVGGGSGGHITPAVAVVREILDLKPRTRVEFWTDRKYYKNVVKITTELGVHWGEEAGEGRRRGQYIRVRKIAAGKFRRYAGWTWKDWMREWKIVLKDVIWGNLVGFCGFMAGMVQSTVRLMWPKKRPDVIFLKGGFVGLPVGIVARWFKIPYIVHESDMVPGLANRILMKKAAVVATGWKGREKATDESESSGQDVGQFSGQVAAQDFSQAFAGVAEVVCVGIPVAPEFKEVSETKQKTLKKTFGFDPEKPLVVVTGGSQGSLNIDEAMRVILPEMLKFTSVGLVAGRKHYETMVELKKYEEWDKAKLKSNFRMWEFNSAMHELMGAADVVVSRAGATTIAELAALKKAVILVPFEMLPGGHQLKNAENLRDAGAVMMVADREMQENPEKLLDAARHLVRSPKEREVMAEKLQRESRPGAAKELAAIILRVGEKR